RITAHANRVGEWSAGALLAQLAPVSTWRTSTSGCRSRLPRSTRGPSSGADSLKPAERSTEPPGAFARAPTGLARRADQTQAARPRIRRERGAIMRDHVADSPRTSTGPAASAPRARRPHRRRAVAVAVGVVTAALVALNTVVVSQQTAPATGDLIVRLDD